MFYKYIESLEEWAVTNEVRFPDGTILNENNKETKDDFVWCDTPPQEYLDFINTEEI